jgi:hypothetical protein
MEAAGNRNVVMGDAAFLELTAFNYNPSAGILLDILRLTPCCKPRKSRNLLTSRHENCVGYLPVPQQCVSPPSHALIRQLITMGEPLHSRPDARLDGRDFPRVLYG